MRDNGFGIETDDGRRQDGYGLKAARLFVKQFCSFFLFSQQYH